jgi:hypothetical protein
MARIDFPANAAVIFGRSRQRFSFICLFPSKFRLVAAKVAAGGNLAVYGPAQVGA